MYRVFFFPTILRVNVTQGRIQNTVKDLRWSFLQK